MEAAYVDDVSSTSSVPAALVAAGLLISAPACPRISMPAVVARTSTSGGVPTITAIAKPRRGPRRRPPSPTFSLDRHGEYRSAERDIDARMGERDRVIAKVPARLETGYRDAFNQFTRDSGTRPGPARPR